jgi:hypothetical protein
MDLSPSAVSKAAGGRTGEVSWVRLNASGATANSHHSVIVTTMEHTRGPALNSDKISIQANTSIAQANHVQNSIA